MIYALAAANPMTGDEYLRAIASFAPFLILIIVFYFFMLRPQKKREKEEREMRNSIQPGDEISTIGGIIGRVVSIKDDTFVIESTADRTKIKLYRWAIRGKLAEPNTTADSISDTAEK